MTGLGEYLAESMRGIPSDDLPILIARAVAALRAEGIDVTDEARRIVRQLPSMRAYAALLTTDEERIDELYDRLRRTESSEERTELLRQLRRLQKEEADRLVAEADSSTGFRPRDALSAIADARRLTRQHAAPADDPTAKHRD